MKGGCGKSYFTANRPLHTERELVDGLVYHAGNTQRHDAQRTDGKAGTRVVIAAESGDRLIALVDVHCLYNLQIVVKRQNRID